MGHWKELGEVPDSDDEALDSQEIQDGQITTNPALPVLADTDGCAEPDTRDDVLPLQESQRPQTPTAEQTLASSSPLSSLGEEDIALWQDDWDLDAPGGSPPQATPRDGTESLAGRSSPPDTSPARPLQSPVLGNLMSTEFEILIPRRSAVNEPEPEVASSCAPVVRAGRSFRPRKPIQEHPYQLESVQYSTFMKSHGIKPIRVAIEHSSPKRGDEDSQDQEFTAEEESQQASGGQEEDASGENLPGRTVDLLDYSADELALSPSPRTSSPRRAIVSSSRVSEGEQTEATSLADEDDFPSLHDLSRRRHKTYGRAFKRQASAKLLPNPKRPKTTPPPASARSPSRLPFSIYDDFGSSPSLEPSTAERPIQSPPPPTFIMPPDSTPTPSLAPLPSARNDVLIDLSSDDEDGNEGDAASDVAPSAHSEGEGGSGSDSDSESDVVRINSRRIRGVLPASWLRLDQQKPHTTTQRATKARSPAPSPDRLHRRGVAMPKHGNAGASSAPVFLSEESEEEPEPVKTVAPRVRDIQPTLPSSLGQRPDVGDGASIIEEDVIDRMLPGRKRESSPLSQRHHAPKRKKMRNSSTIFKGQPGRTWQPKITKMLSKPNRPLSSAISSKRPSERRSKSSRSQVAPQAKKVRAPTPPMLSILDFVEPEAPRFIRIAARTAKTRKSKGKSSPTQKRINLGNRKDNVDALSVLRDWKKGRIKPKPTAVPSQREQPPKRHPLGEISTNAVIQTNLPGIQSSAPTHEQSFIQRPIGSSVVAASKNGSTAPESRQPLRSLSSSTRRAGQTLRPAQLETVEQESPGATGFVARKRALDAVFRGRRKSQSSVASVRLDKFIDDQASSCGANDSDANVEKRRARPLQAPNDSVTNKTKSRFRKRHVPISVDTAAPQFIHALDPLPTDDFDAQDIPAVNVEADRLAGLGPFGTLYSQHFDIFPLSDGVFFHESTLVGSGCLRRLTDGACLENLDNPRPRIAYQFGERELRWGPWDDATSSELGILLDWIAERALSGDSQEPATASKIAGAARFVLDYVQNAASFPEAESRKSFASRCSEVLASFVARFRAIERDAKLPSYLVTPQHIGLITSLLPVAFFVLRVCRDSAALAMQSFQAEEDLKKLSSLCIKMLLDNGLDTVRAAYNDLQRLSFRERGIRNDKQLLISWVTLMRLLTKAQMPRASFWDLVYSVMLGTSIGSCLDANFLEKAWKDMFTLLPLGEFDTNGLLVRGLRHTMPLEGWTLPQQALKRVFQLYKTNARQSPSFNEYCRASVGRCYYLVQHWGWHKCNGIVGVIFDFYGSQDLAHLRNEEVYKSPRFLEELAASPSLSIEPEDKCFHVFAKMVGLVILRLRELGLTNDIRNLIARTLPNHNRQYLKENDIHQRDLAALRNHHDLLCTLFWAAPPDLRPGVHLLEKLVAPANSHKEACLISLRAWSQLARFVVASGESPLVYKPFISWQNNMFQQVLDQYLSAASDLQKQFLGLSKVATEGISQDFLNAMISKNKAAALDILHFCIVSSLDVLKKAKSLEMATYCLNTSQLGQVFAKLDLSSPKCDWKILLTAIETVEHYVERVETALDEQYSSSADAADARQTEDAVLMLEHKLAKSFFSMTRQIMGLAYEGSALQSVVRSSCTERSVALSARLASRFIHAGICRLSRFFGHGDFCLFDRRPQSSSDSLQRVYLPLFVATVIKNNVFDFKDVGTSMLELWMLAITKPRRFLKFENQLGQVLQQHGLPYLQSAFVPVGTAPSYSSNRDLFAYAIRSMRRSLREAEGSQRQQLRSEFKKALEQVMQQMKDDLKCVKDNAAEHEAYVMFVRGIVALIRSHGVDIRGLDQFFYQWSQDYSPSMEDPKFQTAGIISYGVRLGEGELTAAPQLFHFLCSNINLALDNARLDEECKIVEKSMENADVLSFMLSRMLPAIIRATSEVDNAWPLLDVYIGALQRLLAGPCLPMEIETEDAVGLLEAILTWLKSLWTKGRATNAGELSLPQAYIMGQLAGLANVLQSTLMCPYPPSTATRDRSDKAISSFSHFARELVAQLDSAAEATQEDHAESALAIRKLLGGVEDYVSATGQEVNPQTDQFAKWLAQNVRENWVVNETHVLVKKAGRAGGLPPSTAPGQGGQGGQGTPYGPWTMDELLGRLYGQAKLWRLEPAPVLRGQRLAGMRAASVAFNLEGRARRRPSMSIGDPHAHGQELD